MPSTAIGTWALLPEHQQVVREADAILPKDNQVSPLLRDSFGDRGKHKDESYFHLIDTKSRPKIYKSRNLKSMKRLIVLNPNSKNGKAAREFQKLHPEIEARLGQTEVYLTKAPGDATVRIRAALKEKAYLQILVAGGDGTINEAVNGYFENGKILSQAVPMGVINLGTGGDFYKTIREFSGLYDVSIKENSFQLVDCGVVERAGDDLRHYFINISSVGMAGFVLDSLKKSSFQWGAPAYFYHSLKTLVLYQPHKVTIDYKDPGGKSHSFDTDLLNFFVCNGKFSGGGMGWAPRGEIRDGIFNLTLLAGSGKMQLVTQSSKIYAGRISEFPGVKEMEATEVNLHHKHRVKVEADGEVLPEVSDKGGGEVRFRMLPQVFPLIL